MGRERNGGLKRERGKLSPRGVGREDGQKGHWKE